jgi:PIN domain nuclease of toxin-antitoxin system
MIYLLDTQVVLWLEFDPGRVTPAAQAALRDPAARLLLSVATIWELQIKSALGKIALPGPLGQFVADVRQRHRLDLLPVDLSHVLALEGLPSPHKDPFDRLLCAQALAEGATLLTADAIFAQYPAPVLW